MELALNGLHETEEKMQSKLDELFQGFYTKHTFNEEQRESLIALHSFCKKIIGRSCIIHVHTSTLIHYLEHTPHPTYLSFSIPADSAELEKTISDLVHKKLDSMGKSLSDAQIIYFTSPKNKALQLVDLENALHFSDLIWGYYLSDTDTIQVHILM